MYKIIINICLEICKKHVMPKKSPRKHQIPRDRRALMRKRSKLQKKIQMSPNNQTKENVLNQIKKIENNLKISINTEINLRETRTIAAIKNNPKYFYKFVKNNSKIRAGIGPLQDEEGNFEPSNQKMSELLNELMRLLAAEPRSIAGVLFPCQYLCRTILVIPCSMVCYVRVSRAGPMPFIGLAAHSRFVSCCFPFLFFHSVGWCCGVGVFGLIGC